jgi:hypothetical protein
MTPRHDGGNGVGTAPAHDRQVTDAYRSYVIRIRRQAVPGDSIRLELEDLVDGHRAALNGDEARALSDRLLAVFDPRSAQRRPGASAAVRRAGKRP